VGVVERVLIVGGGIGGLTLAVALHQRGFDVELVERNGDWRVVGAGLSVQPNGVRVLHALGLDSGLVRAGEVIGRWIFADEQGAALCEIDLGAVWEGVAPCVGIARSRLQEVLAEGAHAVPSRLGTSVTAIEQADGFVSVTFTDYTTGRYDLVVGADGIHSAVRDLVFGTVAPIFAGQISWRSTAPIRLTGAPSIQFWLGDRCFFGLCSVGDGRTYGFANVTHEHEHDPVEGRLGRLRERFVGFGQTVHDYLACLTSDEQVHCSSIEWVEHDQWHRGRVVLIGDAAHASSPMMGQGGSLAMEDALVLTELLAIESTLERALDAYVTRRAPRVQWVQQQSRAVADSFNLPPHARNEVLRTRGASMFMERYAPLVVAP
jgi:2-polyprenyl-6-methoxyphenol hydroxylase-like FAD-dependent oxidoreductase